jgi:hypothetical protein
MGTTNRTEPPTVTIRRSVGWAAAIFTGVALIVLAVLAVVQPGSDRPAGDGRPVVADGTYTTSVTAVRTVDHEVQLRIGSAEVNVATSAEVHTASGTVAPLQWAEGHQDVSVTNPILLQVQVHDAVVTDLWEEPDRVPSS